MPSPEELNNKYGISTSKQAGSIIAIKRIRQRECKVDLGRSRMRG
jgi:hypothetical protein